MKLKISSKITTLISCSFLVFLLLFSSCYNNATLTDVMYKKSDKFQSKDDKAKVLSSLKALTDSMDAKLFLNAINSLIIPAEIKSNINTTDKISLYSSERMQNELIDLQHIIQFSLINQMINSKYIVLDRETLPLFKTIIEKSNNYQTLFYNNNIKNLNDSVMRKLLKNSKEGNIQFADKIMSYKVINSGIKKSKISNSNKIIRYASVILQLDLIEVASSRILATKIVEGFANDEISSELNKNLEVVHFENTNFELPFSKGFFDPSILNFTQSETTKSSIISDIIFNFKLGSKTAKAEIVNKKNETILNFDIPAKSEFDSYSYSWNKKDVNQKTVVQDSLILNLTSDGLLVSKLLFNTNDDSNKIIPIVNF